jgi:hypothetical protein
MSVCPCHGRVSSQDCNLSACIIQKITRALIMLGPVSWSILALGFLVSALELPGKSPAMTLLFDDYKNRGKNP